MKFFKNTLIKYSIMAMIMAFSISLLILLAYGIAYLEEFYPIYCSLTLLTAICIYGYTKMLKEVS